MPIETICTGCGQRLRVADENAGKLARCPQCGTLWQVPAPNEPTSSASGSFAAASAPSAAPAPAPDQWQLRTAEGRVYGPVPRGELDAWVAQGRLSSDMAILAPNSSDWRPANAYYPALATATPVPSNAFADQPFAGQPIPPAAGGQQVRYYQPHRGTPILVLGILSVVCSPACFLGVLGPIAWAMGHHDLREMREGRMDPAGKTQTQAGLVLGIIGTILLAVMLVLSVLSKFN